MKYILDAQIVIWLASNSPRLSEDAKRAILDPLNEHYVSIVSAWEAAIKIGLGKLRINGGVSEFFRIIYENGFETLPLKEKYVHGLPNLPLIHRDPFDRMIIMTAITEDMSIITSDSDILRYGVNCILS